jgi:hypothetical protein
VEVGYVVTFGGVSILALSSVAQLGPLFRQVTKALKASDQVMELLDRAPQGAAAGIPIYVCMYVYICLYVYVYIYICIYMYMYMYVYVYIYIHMYIYMYRYIYMYTHTHTHTYTCIYILHY